MNEMRVDHVVVASALASQPGTPVSRVVCKIVGVKSCAPALTHLFTIQACEAQFKIIQQQANLRSCQQQGRVAVFH